MKSKTNVQRLLMAMAAGVVTRTKAGINSKGELMVYGVIGDWWDDLDAASVVRQAEQAAAGSEELIVRIHSEGGNLVDGLAIYNALKQSERRVVVYIDGIAASMASAVACAGDVVRMPTNALMMIHKPHLVAEGNSNELRDIADQIDVLEGSYIDCYVQKGNLTAEELEAFIGDGKDHWLTAAECLDMGLCDEILAEPVAVAASWKAADFHNPPASLWKRLVVQPSAARAAKPLENGTMKFKIVASGGGRWVAAILAALAAKYASVEEAAAGLSHLNIEGLEAILVGETEASETVVAALAGAMDVDTGEPAQASSSASTDVQAAVDRAVAAEREADRRRVTQLRALGRRYSLSDDAVNGFIDQGLTEAQARSQALDLVAQRSSSHQPRPGVRVGTGDFGALNVAMAQALLNRADPTAHPLDDASKPFAHLTLIEMARAHLQANLVDVSGMNKGAIAAMAMQSTSDFVGILADVANKSLRRGYEAAPRTFTRFCRRVSAADFKPINRVQLGTGGGSLAKVNESGEFKAGVLLDGKESYNLATYGEILTYTRRTLINDDMDSLSRVPQMQGAQVAETESEVVWALITGNAKLSDNVALFHANHGNLGSGVIGETGLNSMRKAMRTQKKLDAKTPLNLAPGFLIVPAALETTGQKFLARIMADQAGNVNPFAGSMELLVEARLDANSEVEWYGSADPNRIDTIEYCYLEGEEGAYLETKAGFEVDGIQAKVRLDFGAGIIDYRGLYKSSGS